jgi:hypothetical protein
MTRFEKVKIYIESKGGILLSDNVHWNHGNFNWVCDNNHKNTSKLQMLYRKSWCRECIQDRTRNKVVERLNNDSTLKLVEFSFKKCSLVCDKGHEIKMSPSHIIEGNNCGVCFKNRQKQGLTRLDENVVKSIALSKGFTLIDQYKSSAKKNTWKCIDNHVFKKAFRHIQIGIGCPDCNNYFKSERKFRASLERVLQVPFPKCKPEFLINPETGRRLELDCYNKELGLAFEYDGHFHYEVRKGLNNDLEKTKQLDLLKEKLCKENNVHLIRVPYFLKDKDFYEKILEGLKFIYRDKYWMVLREIETGKPSNLTI